MEFNNVEAENNMNTKDKCENDEHHDESNQSTNDIDIENTEKESTASPEIAFKKPVLIIGPRRGKIGTIRSLSDVKPPSSSTISTLDTDDSIQINDTTENLDSKKVNTTDQKQQLPLPYKEPSWGGVPTCKYQVEVLKSGVILNAIPLNEKSFYIIGRLPQCDIPLSHPTISRYHAILQYRTVNDDKNETGYYVYDLGSTHGTFWNGCRIRSRHYVKLHGGHMIRFGCSQRKFIFQSPPDEEEKESEYSVTELKEMRRLELLKREEEEKERQEQEEELKRIRERKEEAEGIDWGMGEDADEETDLTENPYASTTNEELFLDDPKKTLRGWFEREGHDMQYEIEEKGIGQFLCWIELPIDNLTGRPVRAEALVKGKKKECVIQCALEACRILDRQGLLRQATHEGKKRKIRNWEEEDYYDSDEDNFLDRTGTVERKREQRMRNAGKLETKAETYTTLVEKYTAVVLEIKKIQTTLKDHEKAKDAMNDNSNEDALDAFMSNLSSALLNKSDIMKMKLQLQNLRKEEEELKKLIDITKPANLPSLTSVKLDDSGVKSEKSFQTKKSAGLDDKRQRLDTENAVKGLVVNKGRYGLIKNDEVNVKEEELCKSCDLPNEEYKNDMPTKNDEEMENPEPDNNMRKIENEILKRKKRNLRKNQQKAEKAAKEVEKGYDENLYREDYSMWVPPTDQSGDGKTSLNDKLGY